METSGLSVALISLGCTKNLVDSEVMMGLLERAGYRLVEEAQEADVIIVNTCAFIEPAVEEALDALLDLAELKQTGHRRALICAGCLTERYGSELLKQLPEVDIFLNPGAVPQVAEAVRLALSGQRQVIRAPLNYLYCAQTPRWRSAPDWLAYVKIAEGCDNHCTFCTVPRLRGAYRSRTVADLRQEVTHLVAEGVREIILIAQDTTYYGRDLAPPLSLTDLVQDLSGLDYEGWLRIMYMHPAWITEPLLQAMAECPAAVPYLDLPLQHTSPTVLQRMRRGGSAERYLELLELIRGYLPEAALRTTFIVGFPGETDKDFERLQQFMETTHFDRVAAFRYWPEEGTSAATLPNQVPIEVADERLEQLLQVQERISLSNNQRFIGRPLQVLVEQVGPQEAVGRSYRDAPEVDGEIILRPGGELQPGEFVIAEITSAEIHDLVGKPM